MIDHLKIVVGSLKLLKWLPGVQTTPSDEYTGKSPLTGGEYTEDSRLPAPWEWINHEVDFLVYFEQESEQLYKKYFLVNNRPGSLDSPVY